MYAHFTCSTSPYSTKESSIFETFRIQFWVHVFIKQINIKSSKEINFKNSCIMQTLYVTLHNSSTIVLEQSHNGSIISKK